LRITEDVQVLRIDRIRWLAAVRATYYDRKQKSSGETPILNSDGVKVDLLTRELEKMDNVEPSNTNGTGEVTRERRSSLGLTTASDSGVEQEKLLAQHQALNNLSNSSKISTDSPQNSGRNTPTLTQKHRRHLFRSATTTTSPPPSTNNESPSSNYNSTA
jgi:hypothetical protein